jgi:hypothetical protein
VEHKVDPETGPKEGIGEAGVIYFRHSLVMQSVSNHRKPTACDAAFNMARHGVGSVVVVEGKSVLGILTREDRAATAPDLMRTERCVKCSTLQHLRHGTAGARICPACEAQALAKANALSSE